mmetsp:Transcript_4309/g.5746  ORF Transcript_4309/g.5746 Transcript_4309/m.5746 type:complete len:221 (+) Transcript_4309:142-804(+)
MDYGSDAGSGEAGDRVGAKLSHGSEDALHVGSGRELGCGGFADGGVLTVGVLVHASDQGEHGEIGVRDFVASGVGATISPLSIDLLDELFQEGNAGLDLLLGGLVTDESHALGLLNDVDDDSVEPLELVDLQGGLGHVAVLKGEALQDSHALHLDGAIVSDIDGHLGALAVGGGGLDGAPLGACQSLVLKGDTLGGEQEADGLGATLYGEVKKLGHISQK